MVCSFCGMTGHNATNCEVKITARARCIFENDYDPIFYPDDPLNRKYWWKRIIIKNVDEYGESWWYENQISQAVLPMVQVEEVEENVEAYKHIGYSIDNNQDLPDAWREKMNNIFGMFNASITSLSVISVNSRDWKPVPKAWFSRNHNAGLKHCFLNRDDSLQARYRVLMHLKELHEEQYPEGSRPHYIESNNVGAHYIESDNVGAGEPAYGESDLDSDGDTVISPPAIRTDQLRNPGEMPDLRRPDLQIETPSDTQPTNVTVSDSTTCGICWDELGEANVMVTKCGHKFCCDCILSHFQNAAGTNCPLCREEYASRVPGWLPPHVEEEIPRRRRGRPRRNREQWTEQPYTPPPASENVPNVVENIPNIPINNLIHDLGTTEGAAAIGNAIIEALRSINATRV